MLRRSLFIAGVVAASVAIAPQAQAQLSCSLSGAATSCGVNHSLEGTVPTLATLTQSAALTTFASPTVGDFTGGQTVSGPLINVDANVPYTVSILAQQANFNAPASVTKPAGDARFLAIAGGGTCGAGSYAALTTSNQPVYTGIAGDSGQQRLCFQIDWDLANDAPGSYSLPLTLTLSAP